MKSDILSLTDLTLLPELAFMMFGAIFFGALYMVLRPGAKEHYERHRRMALDDAIPVTPMEVRNG